MASPVNSSSSSSNCPCAGCKFLRRKCTPGCIFAPYFSPEDPQKFAKVHRVFGASNVAKLLNELLPHQREDAVNSLAYEAEARVKDPVYGCVATISALQQQIQHLQKELEAAHAVLLRYSCNEIPLGAYGNENIRGRMIEKGAGASLINLLHQPQQQPQDPSLAMPIIIPCPPPPWSATDFSDLEDTMERSEGGGGGEQSNI